MRKRARPRMAARIEITAPVSGGEEKEWREWVRRWRVLPKLRANDPNCPQEKHERVKAPRLWLGGESTGNRFSVVVIEEIMMRDFLSEDIDDNAKEHQQARADEKDVALQCSRRPRANPRCEI